MSLRPSSFPMLAKCSQFDGHGGEFVAAGQVRHSALTRLLSTDPGNDNLDDLPEDEREGTLWAANHIRFYAPMVDFPLVCEQRRSFRACDFSEVYGTPDVVCGPRIFDLKWRERDYTAQMAAYALMLIDSGHEVVKADVLFGATKRVVTYIFNREIAELIINPIVDNYRKGAPAPNEYCKWCAKIATCPAVLSTAQTAATGYSELSRVTAWHPSQMESPECISSALWIWRNVLKPWGESIEFHAKEAVIKKGTDLPDFTLSSRKGKTFCVDVATAFSLAGIPQEKFLAACDLRMNSSKKYPDKVGIVDIYAEANGLKKAAAKRDVVKLLGPVLRTTQDSVTLRAKSGDEESEDES